MAARQTIYVSAYPKSGSTWLTRLLGDVLNSPTGGCMPEEDAKEVATEGQDRPGPYVVRKGHYVLIEDDTGPVVPRPHRMAYKQLTDEKIVFLVRDPRDICISGAWHWRTEPAEFLDRMIKGDVAKCGRWDEYVDSWLKKSRWQTYRVRYEDLMGLPFDLLTLEINDDYGLLDWLSLPKDKDRVLDAIKRQSFAARKAQIGNDEKELRRNNMRKGVVGDWRNHFTLEMNDKIWSEFGWIMERLGYEHS